MACPDPDAITGGTVITSGPYNDASLAVYQCLSGYVMSGDAYITCTAAAAWSTDTPLCSKQDTNSVSVTLNEDDGIPTWLVYMIAVMCGLFALLLLTCILVVCCQLFGCYGGGAVFGDSQPGNSVCCCRKRRDSYDPERRVCKTYPRRYAYDDNGRRYHIDDVGRRCYYEHKNQHTGKVVTYSDSETTESTAPPRAAFVTTVNEVIVEKRQQPAKELLAWKPHANSIRNINTSTK